MKYPYRTVPAFIIYILILSVFAGRPLQASVSTLAPSALSCLIEEGLAENEELQSLAAKVAVLKEEISFNASLNDPRFGIGLLNIPADSFRFDKEAMTQKQISITQKIPWFGKLSLRSLVAASKANRQEAIFKAKQLEIIRKITTSYYKLGFIVSSQGINERLINMMGQILRSSEIGYETGRVPQQNIFQAQVKLSNLLNEKILLSKKRRSLEYRINELLNRESFAPVQPYGDISFTNIRLNIDELKAMCLKQNPWVHVRKTEIDQAQLEIELALKDYWPDMDFKIVYGQRDKDINGRDLTDFVSTSVVMNIPLWMKTRQNKKLAANKARYQAAIKSYGNIIKSLPYQVNDLVNEIHNSQESYRLFSNALLVQAKQWASSTIAAYEVGEVEFDTMINSQVQILRFELQARNYVFSIYQKLAELGEIIGEPLIIQDTGSASSAVQNR